MSSLLFLLVIGLITFAIMVLAMLRLKHEILLDKKVKALFSAAGHYNGKTYDQSAISTLPEPVQRYFKMVLKDGKPYTNIVRLKHTGRFRTGRNNNWMSIRGEEYFTVANPGMVWIGKTKWFTACDSYLSGKGSLTVKLLSVWKIAGGSGFKFSQGELLRWLGESVWFPTNLLPGENLEWSAIDSNTAKLTFTFKKHKVVYIVTFNSVGEIIQLETKRYMGNTNLETWIGKLSEYREFNEVLVPTSMEAIWRLDKMDFSYAQFRLTQIEYGNRKRF